MHHAVPVSKSLVISYLLQLFMQVRGRGSQPPTLRPLCPYIGRLHVASGPLNFGFSLLVFLMPNPLLV